MRSSSPGSYIGNSLEFQASIRGMLTSKTVTEMEGHLAAMMAADGAPTYPAPRKTTRRLAISGRGRNNKEDVLLLVVVVSLLLLSLLFLLLAVTVSIFKKIAPRNVREKLTRFKNSLFKNTVYKLQIRIRLRNNYRVFITIFTRRLFTVFANAETVLSFFKKHPLCNWIVVCHI